MGVSELAEMVAVAHGNITRAKYDLAMLAPVPFATHQGEGLLRQTQLLDEKSHAALFLVDDFVLTLRDGLDFLLLVHHDVNANTLGFADLTVPEVAPNIRVALANAASLGNETRNHLELVIALLDTTYTGLCVELAWRGSGYFPWTWWYPRAGDHLNTLVDLLQRNGERVGVHKSVLAKKNVLKLLGTRLSSLLRRNGEIDFMVMAEPLAGSIQSAGYTGSSNQIQEATIVEEPVGRIIVGDNPARDHPHLANGSRNNRKRAKPATQRKEMYHYKTA
ncbi:hypothetical protein BDZ89DRAFT_1052813 [Hymenopellis radicata]|nr:hypothetical protein BDZ89DRAFT_1052813 [Hymenopellis radicata]